MEVNIPDSAIAEDPSKTITLPSGRIAIVRAGKGRDLREVYRRIALKKDKKAGAADFVFELVVQLCQIDGQPVVAEDLDEMPLDDVMALQAAVNGGDDEEKKTSSEAKDSSSSSNMDSSATS